MRYNLKEIDAFFIPFFLFLSHIFLQPVDFDDAFECAKKEFENVAHVQLTKTNKYAKKKKQEDLRYKKEQRQRVQQCHGRHGIPLTKTKVSRCLSDGTLMRSDIVALAANADQTPAQAQCPNLKYKWEMVEIFNAALHYILGNVRPCDYFENVHSLKGCADQKTIPPTGPDKYICRRQCGFVRRISRALGVVMDDLFPPTRDKRGTCYAYQTTSAHLRLFHIVKDYCK